MFRFIARRLPRFGLPTLIALMLLVVSIGGAVRIGFGPDYEAATALQALDNEGLGYSAHRPFSGDTDSATLSADAWNPFRRLAHWLLGQEDRVGGIMVYGWPSEETREKLFDLPHVYEVVMDHPNAEGPAAGQGRVPLPGEILNRPLPKFAHDAALPSEPPPVPTGVPLSDEEREEVFRELTERVDDSPFYVGERFLCRGESTDLPGFVLTTASDGVSSWQLRYRRSGGRATAKTELRTPEVFAHRLWEEGWHTFWAVRTADDDLVTVIDPSIRGHWRPNHLVRAYWFDGDADDAYESVQRLEDGTLLLRVRPRALGRPAPPRETVRLVEGLLIVDQQNDYVVTRFDAVEENRWPGMTTSVRYVFEYARQDGHVVPVRFLSWTDLPAHSIEDRMIAGGPHVTSTRYAWEFDPDLPASLFEPPQGQGEFFAAAPPTGKFQWWWVTGGLALGWLYFIVSRGILRRFRRAKSMSVAHEDSPVAIAEPGKAS